MTSADYNKNLISQMTDIQLEATMQNANLKKKLRVERIKKMTQGNNPWLQGSGNSAMEDPNVPDWKKYKSLHEIDMIRQTKKDLIIQEVMGSYLTGAQMVTVVPGEVTTLSHMLHNQTNETQVYTIQISDPDKQFLEQEEVSMVSNQVEYEFWVSKGKAKKPKSYSCITNVNSVTLRANEKFDLLFKFMTYREVSHSHLVQSSGDLIK